METTSKEFLSQAYLVNKQINIKYEQLERLRCRTYSSTVSYGYEQVSHSPNVSSMQDAICYMMEKEDELDRAIDRLVDLKAQISGVIDGVKNARYHQILEERYLSFKSWRQIADDLACSPRWVRDAHDRALRVVDQLLKGEAKPAGVKDTTLSMGSVRAGTTLANKSGRIRPCR